MLFSLNSSMLGNLPPFSSWARNAILRTSSCASVKPHECKDVLNMSVGFYSDF